MKQKVEQLLPLIKSGQLSKPEAELLLVEVRLAIQQDPSQGKELGQLIGLINHALKSTVAPIDLNWVAVGGGHLAIGHKPGGKIPFAGLKSAGTTAVLTLLQENEGAAAIGLQAKNAGMDWIWFPFSASKPPDDKITVLNLYEELAGLLRAGGKIYLHCSAGIHRTGMITFGLLQYLGLEKQAAMETLHKLRAVTAEQVGADRLIWAAQFAGPAR